MPGTISRTTTPEAALTAGTRTVWPATATDSRTSACRSRVWNEHDPYLKERLFGLANEEGNHGEDVKEYYYYLDGLPSHAFMRMLYKYPQVEYPYDLLYRGKPSPRPSGPPSSS